MKPISISFQCFGPYMARQKVDFAELERSGLFLICGETGAGKTTILDAMCVALYGRASNDKRGELSDMRCKLAGKGDVTEVEFTFASGNREYKFVRSLRIPRTKEVEDQQCFERIDGDWHPMLVNSKKTAVNAKAADIIGLSYDQFRQVILLPQGQFERLLTSKSEEKEEILTKLFHAERWSQAVESMYRRVTERVNALNRRREQIALTLNGFNCASLEELQHKAVETEAQHKELGARVRAADAELGAKRKQKEQALLEAKEFEDLAQRERRLAELQGQETQVALRERNLALAEEADALRPFYDAYRRAEGECKAARENADRARRALESAQQEADRATAARASHEAERSAYNENRTQLVQLQDLVETYATLAEKQSKLDALKKDADLRSAEAARAERALHKANADWEQALQAQAAVREELQEKQRLYLDGIGVVLAEKLAAGKPCPVCGSIEHPAPAVRAEGEPHVTDAELDKLSRQESMANREEERTRKRRNEAELAKEAADKAMHEAESALQAARADYAAHADRKVEGIDTPEALDRAIRVRSAAIAAFEEADRSTLSALQTAENNVHAERANSGNADSAAAEKEKAYRDAQEAWVSKLQASPLEDEAQYLGASMAPEERKRMAEECHTFRAELKNALEAAEEKRLALAGRNQPDLTAIVAAVDAADLELSLRKKEEALAENELNRERSSLQELTQQKAACDAEQGSVDADRAFVERLRGTAGVSLQRYVLGVRFEAIIGAANRLLETVYGSRYRLRRTDEATGKTHKKGLELEVFDTTQGQNRSVNTLSGGEKFLVALSLAIGLSGVVRGGGGVPMEALFVDEGFGSLDDNAVDDAVEILQGIRKGMGSVVGVISHVARLAESIPTKLVVRKGKSGSTICPE